MELLARRPAEELSADIDFYSGINSIFKSSMFAMDLRYGVPALAGSPLGGNLMTMRLPSASTAGYMKTRL